MVFWTEPVRLLLELELLAPAAAVVEADWLAVLLVRVERSMLAAPLVALLITQSEKLINVAFLEFPSPLRGRVRMKS
jgi:hypothetical protein